MRTKRSKLWLIPDNTIQDILDTSETMTEVCRRLDVCPSNGSVRTVYRRIEGFDTTKFRKNYSSFHRGLKIGVTLTHDEIFIVNSTVPRKTARKVVLRDMLIPYFCLKCKCGPEWNGEKLTLQLEHINGVNNDHRLDNLCFLCPNCHSQTLTFGSKNKMGV